MAAGDDLTVGIWRDGARVAGCYGPDTEGQCSAGSTSVQPLCAGAELVMRSAPDDSWHFTVSSAARGCPLAWLVSHAGSSTAEGLVSGAERRKRRTRAFWR